MRVKFHGPLDRVTGSCYELQDVELDLQFLVDCGMRQGDPEADAANAAPFPFDPSALKFVVLTHAHLDHCGLLPKLYRDGFRGTVYCTKETAALARVVLRDAAQRGDAPFKRKHVDAIQWHEHEKALFGNFLPVHKNVFLRFFRTGHLLGAVSVTVVWGAPPQTGIATPQRSITFSGDLGPNTEEREHLPMSRFRMEPQPGDYCVVESTYGGVVRPPEDADDEARLGRLAAHLDAGLFERGGPVILPCFALGRTQDVLFDLHALFLRHSEKYAGVPVYFDGPMAARANRVYADAIGRTVVTPTGKVRPAWLAKCLFDRFGLTRDDPADEALLVDCLREMLRDDHEPAVPRRGALAGFRRLWVDGESERGRLPGGGPAIIVTGGGMCDGGPVQSYLANLLPDERTTVLLTGYCGPQTVGGRLLSLAEQPLEQRARLERPLGLLARDLRMSEIRAHVGRLSGYSAHPDQAGLLDWVFVHKQGRPIEPAGRTVFISHGDATPRQCLATAIADRGRALGVEPQIVLPVDAHGWYDLDAGRWDEHGLSEIDILRARLAELTARLGTAAR